EPPALVLLLSPTARQSSEVFRKVLMIYHNISTPIPKLWQSALRLELANGSRIVALPGIEATLPGYSGGRLLVVDEAAQCSDDLYKTIRPVLSVSQGRLVALSTPYGRRGWFYQEWESNRPWTRVRINANECPRISRAFLEEEKQVLGERWY